jgi:Fur family ferric uptake transcriptional regulator
MPKAAKEPDSTDLLDKLDGFLQRKSLKLTSQRRRIVEHILDMPKTHFAADDLVDQFRDETPRVSKATVYRALAVLVEAGILEQHDFGESHKVFEVSEGREHHDHLMCTSCHKIIEFHNDEMEALQEKIAEGLGFHPTHHSQNIYGICKDCWRQGAR